MNQTKWDDFFLDIAEAVRKKSKDPSAKIGVVIVGPDNQIISTGFNGFPRMIDETLPERWERPTKYDYIVHGETNAIYNAARHGIPLRGCTMYEVGFGPPTVPCKECSKAIIQAGIVRFVGRASQPAREAWINDLTFAAEILREANIECIELDSPV